MNEALSILKKYWGHNSFRPLQEEIIRNIADGHDVLALLPTGGGKSVCFQVPSLMRGGMCIVVSPLVALMKDQVENLTEKGIPSLSLHSGMSYREVRQTLQQAADSDCRFLYVSPERLETRLFEEFLPAMEVSLIAIDEAHCISQWGYDFRPSYLKIAGLRNAFPDVPLIALTASATLEVQNDICEKLRFGKTHQRFQQSFARPNLSYAAIEPQSKQSALVALLKQSADSSVVYAKTRKQTEQISALLQQHGMSADFYHAGLPGDERNNRQKDWISGRIKTIVCTNAFGMGIDKPDVRLVAHFGIPESIENYYQEAGRAGRDGNPAKAALLYDSKEFEDMRNQVAVKYPDYATLKKLYIDLMNHLQVAAGIGEGMSFDFDISTFSELFNWNRMAAGHGLQALAKDGLFFISESSFRPSRLVFTAGKETLYDFEKNFPMFEPVIKGLLRSYEGIFDQQVSINEKRLAGFISIPLETVKSQLQTLHRYQIVRYEPASEKPAIVLLRNRMYSDDFIFNIKEHEIRKEKHQARLESMIRFVTSKGTCRSVMIAGYFNDPSTKACGICDNCLSARQEQLSETVFNQLAEAILTLLKRSSMTPGTLLKSLSHFDEKQLQEVLGFLKESGKIGSNRLGQLTIKSP